MQDDEWFFNFLSQNLIFREIISNFAKILGISHPIRDK